MTASVCMGLAASGLCFALFLARGGRMPEGDEAKF